MRMVATRTPWTAPCVGVLMVMLGIYVQEYLKALQVITL